VLAVDIQGNSSSVGRSVSAPQRALEARQALVFRNMCDLMREMGGAHKFSDPDEWLDSIVHRPRGQPANRETRQAKAA
jgi:hypothetical protein